jgi:hypothetical protein
MTSRQRAALLFLGAAILLILSVPLGVFAADEIGRLNPDHLWPLAFVDDLFNPAVSARHWTFPPSASIFPDVFVFGLLRLLPVDPGVVYGLYAAVFILANLCGAFFVMRKIGCTPLEGGLAALLALGLWWWVISFPTYRWATFLRPAVHAWAPLAGLLLFLWHPLGRRAAHRRHEIAFGALTFIMVFSDLLYLVQALIPYLIFILTRPEPRRRMWRRPLPILIHALLMPLAAVFLVRVLHQSELWMRVRLPVIPKDPLANFNLLFSDLAFAEHLRILLPFCAVGYVLTALLLLYWKRSGSTVLEGARATFIFGWIQLGVALAAIVAMDGWGGPQAIRYLWPYPLLGPFFLVGALRTLLVMSSPMDMARRSLVVGAMALVVATLALVRIAPFAPHAVFELPYPAGVKCADKVALENGVSLAYAFPRGAPRLTALSRIGIEYHAILLDDEDRSYLLRNRDRDRPPPDKTLPKPFVVVRGKISRDTLLDLVGKPALVKNCYGMGEVWVLAASDKGKNE